MPLFSDQQKIGIFVLVFSAFFCLLGLLLFFDRALLAFGNVR